MKILITDDRNRPERYLETLRNHPDVIFCESGVIEDGNNDIEGIKVLFEHNPLFYDLTAEQKSDIVRIGYTGNNYLNQVLQDEEYVRTVHPNTDRMEGYKYSATIHDAKQVNRILDIIDKETCEIEDVHYILDYDSVLEDLLKPFAARSPFDTSNDAKAAKMALDAYLNSANA